MKKLLFVVLVLFGVSAAYALEVAGVRFDDQVRLESSDALANGAGMRKMAIFRIYAMVLYLPEKSSDAGEVLSGKGAKRVAISLLRDVTAQQFVDGLQEGIADNHNETEMATLRDRVNAFSKAMLGIGEAKTGTRVFIDWLPGSGTRLTVNGQIVGTDIAGEDFYRAILKIWLGSKPVQGDLKQALLGKLSLNKEDEFMNNSSGMSYQAVVAAPGFSIGVRCDESELIALDYLEPRAELAPRNALAAETVRQLESYLADSESPFCLPLRPSGTIFQRRVWAQIAAIPNHQTRTYGEVAKALHNAPRAVGQACGSNPFPLVVPCHRVIASGGGLGGFGRNRGGFLLDVKRWLLAHEGL